MSATRPAKAAPCSTAATSGSSARSASPGWPRAFGRRIRAGDLGALPVIVGLAIIWTIFQILNPVFLSSNNLVNLLFDRCSVGVISLGIVCVLLVGEIDLSVGSVSGLSSAIVGVLWVHHGLAGAGRGPGRAWPRARDRLLYALLFNRFGMPSFVATLAGLLAFLGLQLYLLGQAGSINLPFDSALVNFAQLYFMPPAGRLRRGGAGGGRSVRGRLPASAARRRRARPVGPIGRLPGRRTP